MEKKELIEERSNYPIFAKYIIQDILGYSPEDFDFEKGKVEFRIKDNLGNPLIVIELKGQGTNLFDRLPTGMSAKQQAMLYAIENKTPYYATCNYEEINLFLKDEPNKCETINFYEMYKNENEFKKFILLFSKEYLVKRNIPLLLLENTVKEEKEITKEFYKLYHETRLMLIKELEKQCNLPKEKALHYTQLFLNRLMFVCFAQDSEKQLLPEFTLEKRILLPIEKELVGEHTYYIWTSISDLFTAINLGDKLHNIPKYNGGLFREAFPLEVKIRDIASSDYFEDVKQNSKYTDNDIDETLKQKIGKYFKYLNPIYKNILIMSSFDFKSEIDINILGHIFEKSIGEIEALLQSEKGERKKFGIYYTPETITEYITMNAIIPYLSKTGEARDIDTLISEWDNELEILEEKVKKIKILDPACGSGAFLNKAVDVLLEIHRAIHERKIWKRKYRTIVIERHRRKKIETEMETLQLHFDDIEQQREIIINNIYGVDINEESVEITKLSLFLKIASKDIELPNLDNNIKCGNSLIDDPAVAGDKAFKWEEEFKQVMDEGGFDVIIGNPPYGAYLNERERSFILKTYPATTNNTDTAIAFINKAFNILNTGQYLGFIVPKPLAYSQKWIACRSFIQNDLEVLVDVSRAFEEVMLEQIIIIVKKGSNSKFYLNDFINKKKKPIKIDKKLIKTFGNLLIEITEEELLLANKVNRNKYISDIAEIKRGLAIQKLLKEVGKFPVLRGRNVGRYFIKPISQFITEDSFKKIKQKAKYLLKPKIVIQNIVTYISKPKESVMLTAAFDEKGLLALDNIGCIFLKDSKIHPLFLVSLLNSNLISWYAYNFIYAKAKLTMRFDKYHLSKIPLCDYFNKREYEILIAATEKMTKLINLIENADSAQKERLIAEKEDLNRQINDLIYKLYGITEEEKKIIEESLR
ncbi:MAG: DNA methyltransferase [Candidatus Micrarchaeia archaeon]